MTGSFATTRWTLVLAAGEGTGRALGELCSLYRSPLLAHARRRGLSSADADDAVQGFLARLLRLESLATARLRAEHPNPAHFDALLPCLAGRTADTPHSALASQLNLTEPAVRVVIHRLRQRYRHLLREEVAQTVPRPEDIDTELRHLLTALAP
jgi:hypothetical protein